MLTHDIKTIIIALFMIFSSIAEPSFAMEKVTDCLEEKGSATPPGTTILVGSSGVGKSTLAHLLCGRELWTTQNRYIVLDKDKLEGINIIYGPKGTSVATSAFDHIHNRYIVDCPPFADGYSELPPEEFLEGTKEIYNALQGKVNVILIVSERILASTNPYSFIMDLSNLAQLFQNQRELQTMLSLVVSNKSEESASTGELLQNILNKYSTNPNFRREDLIMFFIENIDNRERVVDFYTSSGVHPYVVSEDMTTFINADRPYVDKPRILWNDKIKIF